MSADPNDPDAAIKQLQSVLNSLTISEGLTDGHNLMSEWMKDAIVLPELLQVLAYVDKIDTMFKGLNDGKSLKETTDIRKILERMRQQQTKSSEMVSHLDKARTIVEAGVPLSTQDNANLKNHLYAVTTHLKNLNKTPLPSSTPGHASLMSPNASLLSQPVYPLPTGIGQPFLEWIFPMMGLPVPDDLEEFLRTELDIKKDASPRGATLSECPNYAGIGRAINAYCKEAIWSRSPKFKGRDGKDHTWNFGTARSKIILGGPDEEGEYQKELFLYLCGADVECWKRVKGLGNKRILLFQREGGEEKFVKVVLPKS